MEQIHTSNPSRGIYVGCALTHAPREFVSDVQKFKQVLRSRGPVLDFVGLSAGTPRDVYETDRTYARESLLLVAVCDHQSIGLGMELEARFSVQKPVLILAQDFSQVTRMVEGAASYHPENLSMIAVYSSLAESGLGLVQQALDFFNLKERWGI